jgi:chemotaxis protein MotC
MLGVASAIAQSDAPYQLLRDLQAQQTKIAIGAVQGGGQGDQIAAIGARLSAFEPEVWSDPRNTRSLVAFLLSGGSVAVVRNVLSHAHPAANEQPVLDAALAWAAGRTDEARTRFASLDPRLLAPDIAGHVALVEANLVVGLDRGRAIALLNLARLLAPGTLVEEAALRRQVFLVSETGPASEFVALVRRYRERFPASAYRGNFETRVRVAVGSFWIAGDAATRAALASVIEGIDAGSRDAVWLAIARTALLAGRLDIARDSADRVVSPQDVSMKQRAAFYSGMTGVVAGETGAAGTLEAIKSHDLDPSDRVLRLAGLAIAVNIRRPIDPAPQGASFDDAQGPVGATISRAEALMKEALR